MAEMQLDLGALEALRDGLSQLMQDLSKASTDRETQEAMKRLEILRASIPPLKDEKDKGQQALLKELNALSGSIEEMIREARFVLQRKRKIQEGEAMKRIEEEKANDGIPDDLFDAIIQEAPGSRASGAGADSASRTSGAKSSPKKKQRAPVADKPRQSTKKNEAFHSKGPESGILPTGESDQAATPENSASKKPDDSASMRRLAAALAGEYGQDPGFLSRLLGRSADPNIEDDRIAEAHHRAVHNLRRRLVNLELHLKAVVDAVKTGQPVYSLIRGTTRDIKAFKKELKEAKEARPGLSEEMDRLFGGVEKHLETVSRDLGQDIWNQYRNEKQERDCARAGGNWKDFIASHTGANVPEGKETEYLAVAMAAKHLEISGRPFDPALAERNAQKLMESQDFQQLTSNRDFVKDCLENNKVGQAIGTLGQHREEQQREKPRRVREVQEGPQADADAPVLVRRPEDDQE